MRATVRRPRDDDLISVGNIHIDLGRFGVNVKGSPVELTLREFELLRALSQYPDRVVLYDFLCMTLWQSSGFIEKRRLNVMVCRLRAKLAAAWPYTVRTVRGRGYGLLQAPAQLA